MSEAGTVALLGSMLVAGLASSLHCVGMCGPLLIGFTRALGVSQGRGAPRRAGSRAFASLRLDLVSYHAGRLWTYAVLGFLAGWLGGTFRTTLHAQGWHRAVAIGMAMLVLLAGVALLGGFARGAVRLERLGCGFVTQQRGASSPLSPLLGHPSAAARLLLGALMGLIPCGLVYAMLAVVAAFPTPLHAALGMLAFGVGTLPVLSAVLVGARFLPRGLVVQGNRTVALSLILVGLWMMARVWMLGG